MKTTGMGAYDYEDLMHKCSGAIIGIGCAGKEDYEDLLIWMTGLFLEMRGVFQNLNQAKV